MILSGVVMVGEFSQSVKIEPFCLAVIYLIITPQHISVFELQNKVQS